MRSHRSRSPAIPPLATKRAFLKMRDLWCSFDPLNVMKIDHWPDDEYDAYVGPMLNLIQGGANEEALEKFVEWTFDQMGLERNQRATNSFIVSVINAFECSLKIQNGNKMPLR